MRHLLNTLFVLSEESYLALDGENIIILQGENTAGRFPLHNLEGILYFGYKGASPALMGACAKRNISLCFMTPHGRFLARVCGETQGNVLLRRAQYRLADEKEKSCLTARNFIAGKLFNSRWVLERATRDHPLRVDVAKMKAVSADILASIQDALKCMTLESLRGLEGQAANQYFSVFDDLILQNKETFRFEGRYRRPPLDNVNAMLSFIYTILAHDCAAALESVGLDPYVGLLHQDRSGRVSLALDLMEELRPVMADRFVLSCINNRVIAASHFQRNENESVWLNDEGRKAILAAWQAKKQEQITHPFLKEKIPWGLVPYVQSLLLARFLRGDLDEYPPLMWK